MANTGTIIKYVLIFIIIASVVGLGMYYFFLNGKTIDEPVENKLPQCSDGIDNDGDGLIDYRSDGSGDPDCKSANDPFERNLSWLFWLVILILIGGIAGFGYYAYSKYHDKSGGSEVLPEPVSPQRAYQLAISDQLKNRFTDIACRIIEEKDGYTLYEPFEEDVIIEEDRESHSPVNIGKTFQFSFISVRQGIWAGKHLMVYSLSDGEKGIKEGIKKFRSGTWINHYVAKRRDYNLGSPTGEKARLQLLQLEALKEGDKDTITEAQNLLSSLGSGSAFVDESEDEYQQRMANPQQSTKKKGRPVKKTQYQQQQQQPNLDLDGGNEE